MGEVEFPYALDYIDRNGNAFRDDPFFMNSEDGMTVRVNGVGHKGSGGGSGVNSSGGGGVGNYTFSDAPDNIKEMSNSKMSLHSMHSHRSNSSVNSSNRMQQVNGGYVTSPTPPPTAFEKKQITVVMEPGDQRFGFSVVGGLDEGFSPRVDNVAEGTPSDRCGLQLDDVITEVNGVNVERATHHEIIKHIHNNKKNIMLTVRRPIKNGIIANGSLPGSMQGSMHGSIQGSVQGSVQGSIHENPIDAPPRYQLKTVGEPSSGKSSVDGPGGMMKFATRPQPKAVIPLSSGSGSNRDSNVPSKFVNPAFERDADDEFGSMDRLDEHHDDKPKSFNFADFVTTLDAMKMKLKNSKQQEDIQFVQQILNNPKFRSAIKTHNRMTKMQIERKAMESSKPSATNSQFLASEVGVLLGTQETQTSPAEEELADIINKPEFKEMLHAHDRIAKRECLDGVFPDIGDGSGNGDETDPEDVDDDDYIANDEQQVKIVRIDKTDEPLGATVCNEGDAVVISRIIKGGAAEKSGLLHEGDEILEINNNSVRGKDVNEVVELLSELEGTLAFVLVPGMSPHKETLRHADMIVIKALFDYDHGTDSYIPCEELGLSFMKGDILEVLNQNDPDWWQARFLEERNHGLAGLIPSKQFQRQRELLKITVQGEDTEPIVKQKKKCFCGRARRKGKKVPTNSKNAAMQDSEILTYEDMVRIFPDSRKKRPIVLIGPPKIGRLEIRQKMISKFSDRFAAPIPHTTRTPNSEENTLDYNFVTRASFEKSIAAAEFIEHGHFDGHYYGTSFSAVRSVIGEGKTCVLNMHCQALPVLKTSNILPYVIFITIPRKDQLGRLREYDESGEPFNPNVRLKKQELDDLIEKARDMNRTYGHYFDKVIINNDLESTFEEIIEICDHLEHEPQWVPSSWVRL